MISTVPAPSLVNSSNTWKGVADADRVSVRINLESACLDVDILDLEIANEVDSVSHCFENASIGVYETGTRTFLDEVHAISAAIEIESAYTATIGTQIEHSWTCSLPCLRLSWYRRR